MYGTPLCVWEMGGSRGKEPWLSRGARPTGGTRRQSSAARPCALWFRILEGVKQVAEGAVATAKRLGEMFQQDRSRIEGTGRRAGSGLRVHETLKARRIQSMPSVCKIRLDSPFPRLRRQMELMVELGVARGPTGKRRNRLFLYDRYLAILNEGTEPIR